MKKQVKKRGRNLTISLFAGAYGLDLGLEKVGFEVIWANELEEIFCETIRLNRPSVEVVQGDIRLIEPSDILKGLGLKPGDITLLCGGPPCQSFSTAGRRLSVKDSRGNLIFTFIKWVDAIKPQFFLMENVRGLLSAAIKHRPLHERGNGKPLEDEEEQGSALKLILREMGRIGYTVNPELVNAADYGVPQIRERVFFLGNRDGILMDFPKPTHSKDSDMTGRKPWRTLRDAIGGLKESDPKFTPYSEKRLRWLRVVPPGGNWRSLPKELQPEAMGGAYKSGGGKVGFYRRLSWDKPSPTATTAPHQKATDMCHPDYDRPLTVKEYARIQQFPDRWVFAGSTADQYKQIGNAVPVGLAEAVGKKIMEYVEKEEQIGLHDNEGFGYPAKVLAQ